MGGVTTQSICDVLLAFPNLKSIVLGEPLHDRNDSDQTLTWSLGEVGDELAETPNVETHFPEFYLGDNEEFKHPLYFGSLIQWCNKHKRQLQSFSTPQPNVLKKDLMKKACEDHWSKERKVPCITHRVVLPIAFKQHLVQICGGSEGDLRKLRYAEDIFLTDEVCRGDREEIATMESRRHRIQVRMDQGDSLDHFQQLRLVELVISKMCNQFRKSQRGDVNGDIDTWIQKRDELEKKLGLNNSVDTEAREGSS